MTLSPEAPVTLVEDRFERFRRIAWWDQDLLNRARVLVVGAGALGNEVIKNLGLLGIGHLVIVDMDRIEESNLSRSVLFSAEDEGRYKAEVTATAVRRLYPSIDARSLVGNVLGDVGRGWFRWADAVVGALDNREARLFVNATCAAVSRPWIDGGIEVLSGIVRGFSPPRSACYECTMGAADWELVDRRRSCSLLARRAAAEGGSPTTPTTASVIGAMQAQEVVKRLHGLESLDGEGFMFEGLSHNSYRVRFPINPDCPRHGESAPIETLGEFSSATRLAEIWDWAATRLGGLDSLDIERELVAGVECTACGESRTVFRPIHRVTEEEAVCSRCGTPSTPKLFHGISSGSPWLDMTLGQLGLPPWDIVWARHGEQILGMEIAGDSPFAISQGDRS